MMASTEALTQAGLNLIGQALTIYDSDLKLAVCNQRFVEMFDLPAPLTQPGARFDETIRHLAMRGEYGDVGDLDQFIVDRVRTALAFEPHYMERTRSNGHTISVEGAPLPQGGWVTVYTDITDKKQQEHLLRARSEVLSEEVLTRSEELAATNRKLAATISALEEARRELTEMEARTRQTTEMLPAHIAHVDAGGHYTFSNRGLARVLPGRPTEIIGLHIGTALGQQTYARIQPHLEAAFQGSQSTVEFTDPASSRRIRSVFTPDEQDNGAYILSMDVTQETQARVALQQTRRREIAAQLTSGLAHDFSNLLTIILGTQSKLARLALGPEADALIAATRHAAERGGALLHTLADMTGARTYQPEAVHLPAFVRNLETLARPALPPGVSLQVENAIEAPVLFDPGMVQDALLNLILNARDACGAKGRIMLKVSVVQDTWVSFRVADTGPGFSREALARGWDPFFTTKGDQGSGLGLSMVYDAVTLAGGETRLRNGTEGAVVTIRLPLHWVSDAPKPGLVLLVEDSTDLRVTLREALTEIGHSVVEASSVSEALMLLEGLPEIAAVVSDIRLEGVDTGVDLARQVQDRKVVLMTSLPISDPLFTQAQQLAPVLQKPVTTAALVAALMSQTGGRG